jgi:hypothetical protein
MKLSALWISFGLLASTGKVITFNSDALGKAPAGWTIAMTNHGEPPNWEVRKDRTAPTPPHVLAQISDGPTANRFPLAIFNGADLRDGDISVRVKPLSGHTDQTGGVVWRYRDPNNYYLVRENARAKSVSLFKVENGSRTELGRVSHDIMPNTWTILKVSVRGKRFQVYVNHRRILQAEDSTFAGPGKVGLCTQADSVTYFDDFRVNPK